MELTPEVEGLFHGSAAELGCLHELYPGEIQTEAGPVAGYGTAESVELARVRALCEGLERYCSFMPPPSACRLSATAQELGEMALDLRLLPQCADSEHAAAFEGFRLAPPSPEVQREWVPGFSLTKQREIWIPLSCVYLGLPIPLTEHLSYPISTGFAAGETYENAIRAGLFEVIERDSLAIWWLAQAPFPKLEAPFIDQPALWHLLAKLEERGLKSHLFDLTTDLKIPVVGVVQLSPQSFPHVVTMAACRRSTQDAAIRVLEEAASLRTALTVSRRPNDDFSDVLAGFAVAAERFGLYHAGLASMKKFEDRIAVAPVTKNGASAIKDIGISPLVSHLNSLGHEVLVVDVTAPEVRDLGIVVVRVLVPTLMPLTFSHAIRYLAHPRLSAWTAHYGTSVSHEPIPYA
jgi:ribosomal protein S12 methylthiotransferase accessory factor